MIKLIGGWGNLIVLILIIIIFSVFQIKKCNRLQRAVYTEGISHGISVGARGNHVLDYTFIVEGDEFKGFVSSTFCDDTNNKGCHIGDTVIVRYEAENPGNNDLVVKLPSNAALNNN